ncbi:transglycosylase domain-containing protein [Propionibacterium sp.]|uniref:transglycosylase domain-containing protein n=1 Tax=Propionibacterium sp. TaxID=1977903 RepID=UPI0039E8E423
MAERSASSQHPKPRRAAGKGSRKKGGHLAERIVAIIALVVVIAMLAVVIGGFVYYASVKLPDANQNYSSQTTTLYFRDGTTKLGELSIQNRTVVPYDKISDNMKNAAIAAEDRTFWTNRGISPKGIGRSLVAISRGGELQSGSTITQQYIKIRYLNSDQTMGRKLHELALAVKLSTEVSKEDILSGYLNTVYFGRGAYGVERAAEVFFGTTADQLTVPQSAMLAAMINNPSGLDPSNGDEAQQQLVERYDYVLDGMLQAGNISQEDHDSNYGKLPAIQQAKQADTYAGPNGFLINLAVKELESNGLTDAEINGGGLKIITTFDPAMQANAIKTAQDYTAQTIKNAKTNQDPSSLHVAIASVAVGTGEVYSLYGGPDYLTSQLDWATTARPAASTFKAWALIAGLRQGFGLNTVLNGNTFTPAGDQVSVHNDSNVNYGSVALLRATSFSMNTAFTDLVTRMKNGPASVVQAANDAGVPTADGWDLNNRIALGTAQVSPLSNASGFATIANDGRRNTTHVVKEAQDSSGKDVYVGNTNADQTIETGVAQTAQTGLESVVTSGTGTAAQALGRQVIAKTGTKDDGNETTSAWFVGATKQISTAVMYVVGDGNANLDPYSPSGSFSSGLYPARTWVSYMQEAMQGMPKETFDNRYSVSASPVPAQSQTQDNGYAQTPTSTGYTWPTATATSTGYTWPTATATSTGYTQQGYGGTTATATQAPAGQTATAAGAQANTPVGRAQEQAAATGAGR